MIESFKGYINTLLCLGIFVTLLQLIVPKNNYKKYIFSLVGIIMILTVISPLTNFFKNKNLEESVNQVISNLDTYNSEDLSMNIEEKNSILVKEQVISNIKNDIIQKINDSGVLLNDVEVYLEDNYTLKKIRIKIQKINNDNENIIKKLNSVITYIYENYKLDYEKIEVVEEG